MNTHNIWVKTLSIWSFVALTSFCHAAQGNDFISDVVDVEEKMLYAEFWKTKVIG